MQDFYIKLDKVYVSVGAQKVLNDINFSIRGREQWAVTGPSGSGKTVLANTLAGNHFYSGSITASFGSPETFHRAVLVVGQQHRFHDKTNRSDFYYQQRYNSFDAEQTITVAEELAEYETENQSGYSMKELTALLHIEHILNEPLIQLSNGENKRLQLAKALLQQPELLVLDNPFTGLDTDGRTLLHTILDTLSEKGMHLLLITSAGEMPDYITHVATLQQGNITGAVPRQQYRPPAQTGSNPFSAEQLKKITVTGHEDFAMAVKMKNVHVQYGDRKILQNINWEVRRGEHWSVSGANGAGKSTLLSLITADNPQAYANEIYLFDKRRGTGESIWDIKKKIGYVSPELHLYFEYTVNCFQAIASGLFDTIGLFRVLNEEQEEQVLQWMELLQLLPQQHKLLSGLSAGEQRLVLLARALVKNPPLLVLDEPCQGLDDTQKYAFGQLLEMLATHFGTTIIYVSHYWEEIPPVVTRHLRLENGLARIE